MDTRFTSYVSDVKKSGPNVVLFVPEFLGLGDLFFGLKLAQLLRKKYPHAEIHMLTNGNDIPKLQKIAPEMMENIKVWNVEEIFSKIRNFKHEELKEKGFKINSEGKLSADLFIEGPVFEYLNYYHAYVDNHSKLLLTPAYNDDFKPKVFSYNPSGNPMHFIESGFGECEHTDGKRKGILIDYELRDFALADDITKNKLKSYALENLTVNKLLLGSKSIEQYLASTEVSFAYSPEKMPHYHATAIAVAASQKKTDKNIDFLVAGDLENIKNSFKNPELIENLKANGFTHIEFVDLDNPNKKEILSDSDVNDGKVFRVMYKPLFQHADVKNIFKLAHIVGVTGNQSLSEAISAGLIPVYSRLPHDIKFWKELTIYMERIPEVASTFNKLTNTTGASTEEIQAIGEKLDSVMQSYFKLIYQKIFTKYDLGKALTDAVKPLLGEDVNLLYEFTKLHNLIDKKIVNQFKERKKPEHESEDEKEKRNLVELLDKTLKEIQDFIKNDIRLYKNIDEVKTKITPLLINIAKISEKVQETKGVKFFGHAITKSDVAKGAKFILKQWQGGVEVTLRKKNN